MLSVQTIRAKQGISPLSINHNHPAPPPRVALTSEEAAAYLGICVRTLWRLVKSGKLTCVRTGQKYAFSPVVLERFLNGELPAPPAANTDAAPDAGAETA